MATIWQPAVIIRFVGPRFDAAADKGVEGFDVAAELAALKAVVVKVAEALWRGRHPGRARLPKTFAEDARLRFRELARGGAMTVLERGKEGGGQLSIGMPGAFGDDDVERAIDLVMAAVRAAARGEAIPAAFPREAIPLFGAWGKELGDDERCELHKPASPEPPDAYGQLERVALLRAVEGPGLDLAAEVGHVPSIGRKGFELFTDLEAGQGIYVPLSDESAAIVQAAARDYGRVLVRGLGVFDDEGALVRFVHVDAIEPVDSQPPWGGASADGLWEGLPALSKCKPEEPRWADRLEASEGLNAYIYGIGR